MNPKLLRIGLVLVALGVWGAVLVKAFFRRPVEAPMEQAAIPARQATAAAPATEAPLALNWPRDPFLDGSGARPTARTAPVAATARNVATVAPAAHAPSPAPAPAAHWPQLAYKGALNVSGPPGKRVALLAIDGRDVALRAGGEHNGLRVVSVLSDSVVLSLNNTERVLTKH